MKISNKNPNQFHPLCIVKRNGRAPEVKCVILNYKKSNQNDISSIFRRSEIVPDLIDVPPRKYLNVIFPTGVKANLGNVLTPTLVRYKPQVKWSADKHSLYTLLMVDPDFPSRNAEMKKEIRHWLVVNIPGNKIALGQTVYEYIGSAPDPETNYHRYVFLVFKQTSKIFTDEYVADNTSTDQQGRLINKTRDLIRQYNLGDPIYGNFYQAEYDPTADIIRDQIGMPIEH